MGANRRIDNIDILRAIAVLSVCFLHFIVPSDIYSEYPVLRQYAKYGKYGVELFFLISGFIIPYSMYKKAYQWNTFLEFLSRRMIRIEVPFLASMVAIIGFNYLATLHPMYKGESFQLEPVFWLMHLGYLNIFFGNEWVNPVYWTLAIEFHFYITIAIIFPLLIKHWEWRWILLFSLLIPVFFITGLSIFRFYGYFWVGIFSCLYFVNHISKKEWVFGLLVLSTYLVYTRGPFNLVVLGVFLSFVHFLPQWKSKPLLFVGMISYSLYLYHYFGSKMQNLLINYVSSVWGKFSLIPLALMSSLGIATVAYFFIEKTSLTWARKFKYQKNSNSLTKELSQTG